MDSSLPSASQVETLIRFLLLWHVTTMSLTFILWAMNHLRKRWSDRPAAHYCPIHQLFSWMKGRWWPWRGLQFGTVQMVYMFGVLAAMLSLTIGIQLITERVFCIGVAQRSIQVVLWNIRQFLSFSQRIRERWLEGWMTGAELCV